MTRTGPSTPPRSARRHRTAGVLSSALAVVAVLAAVSAATGNTLPLDVVRGLTGGETPAFHGDEGPATRADVVEARRRLAVIDTAGPGRWRGGYDRDAFGVDWADTSGNGCPTRHDVLARDLDRVDTAHDCTVRGGILDDPYTGERLHFTSTDPRAVQVDHVVPLARAWRMGAAEWDHERRVRFANDPRNLLATDGEANMDKGDSGPGDWQPYEGYQCSYAVSYIGTTHNYGLSLTPRDRAGLQRMLRSCG
ncbi:HNH endonuclease family protein [Halostreptopolyspora alba]|uniref:HNH endonuclease n=1 Tax=Halostreptopolyspora alba TaxID=2487137 RepID=A0A3N0EBB3_9ACTN|nr:HNH endonuclease [Nocardiopsaceae bacterium YIM 96095]